MTTEKTEPVADDFDGIGWREYMRGIENGNIDPTGVRLRAVCKIAREKLDAAEQSVAAPARCDAQSLRKALGYNASGLPNEYHAELFAAAENAALVSRFVVCLRDIISIAKDAHATDALGDIVKRAEEGLGND